MKRHTNSRQRKNVSSSGSTMRTQSVRSYSTSNSIPASHPFSSRVMPMPRCDPARIHHSTGPNLRLLEYLATITASHAGLQRCHLEDTLLVEIPLEVIIIQVVVKGPLGVTATAHIQLKEGPHLTVLVLALEEDLITRTAVLIVLLELDVAQTWFLGIVTSNIIGNHDVLSCLSKALLLWDSKGIEIGCPVAQDQAYLDTTSLTAPDQLSQRRECDVLL